MTTLEFWYEFASSYSYPAAMCIDAEAKACGVAVVWKPFLLGPLLQEQQGLTDSPFNIYNAKGRYMWRDLERICARLGLSFNKPSCFPQNSVLAARVIVSNAGKPWISDFTKSVYEANFVENRDISSDIVLSELLTKVGADAPYALGAAETEGAKRMLYTHVDEARQKGIFGAPSFVVGKELFWGHDRLEQALDWALNLESQDG